MRERFVLACRILGLVIFCGGLLNTALSLRMFVNRYDASKMIPQSTLKEMNRLSGGDFVKELKQATDYTWQYISVSLLVGSVVPLALGLYLMKSAKICIKLCYPDENDAADKTLRPPPQMPADEQTKEPQTADDSKYMPPGYEK